MLAHKRAVWSDFSAAVKAVFKPEAG